MSEKYNYYYQQKQKIENSIKKLEETGLELPQVEATLKEYREETAQNIAKVLYQEKGLVSD